MAFYIVSNDNVRIEEQDASITLGPYDSRSQALAAAKEIVDQYLLSAIYPGMRADALLESYRMHGKTAWVYADVVGGPPPSFSPWAYARQRCAELCAVAPALLA